MLSMLYTLEEFSFPAFPPITHLPMTCTFSMHTGRTQMESPSLGLYFKYKVFFTIHHKVFGIYRKWYLLTSRNIARENHSFSKAEFLLQTTMQHKVQVKYDSISF